MDVSVMQSHCRNFNFDLALLLGNKLKVSKEAWYRIIELI